MHEVSGLVSSIQTSPIHYIWCKYKLAMYTDHN